jgi:hypothetical protein
LSEGFDLLKCGWHDRLVGLNAGQGSREGDGGIELSVAECLGIKLEFDDLVGRNANLVIVFTTWTANPTRDELKPSGIIDKAKETLGYGFPK